MKYLCSEDFNQVIQSGQDLILYVFSPNDPVSQISLSAIQEVDGMIGKTFEVYLVNAVDHPEIADALSVKKIPETIGIRNRRVCSRKQGLIYSNQVLNMLRT